MEHGTAEERVNKGVQWLDANAPKFWWERINLEALTLWSPWSCVLGQVFNEDADQYGYESGYQYVLEEHLAKGQDANIPVFVTAHGFLPSAGIGGGELREEWIQAITVCREAVPA